MGSAPAAVEAAGTPVKRGRDISKTEITTNQSILIAVTSKKDQGDPNG
jgi:hypothetical protein